MPFLHRLAGVMLILTALSACGVQPAPAVQATTGVPPQANDVMTELAVAAAADLTPAFQEIGALFTQQTGIRVVFNFGSTGQLAQQIERGAPFDLYYAADKSFVENLNAKGLLIADTLAVYAQGRLALWTRADSSLVPQSIEDLAKPEYTRIAIANPEHAPYGQAAREALERAGIWADVEPRLVFGENVAQTLMLADTGNVDVAIVALSLSMQSDGRWTLIPADLHPEHPLIQMAAVVKGTAREAAARRFVAFVNSSDGHAVMKKYGFVLPGEMIE